MPIIISALYEDKKSASLPVASFNISVRGQIYHSEVIRLIPVEAAAVDDEYLLLSRSRSSANCSSFVMLNLAVSIFGNM